MNWRSARKTDSAALLRFLREREWGCVSFSARLREQSPARGRRIYLLQDEDDRKIIGALLSEQSGLVFPVLEGAAAMTTLPRGVSPARIYSVMGRGSHVAAVAHHMRRPPSNRVDYYLMSLEEPAGAAPKPTTGQGSSRVPPVRVRIARPADIEALYPLQERYELEEVLLPNHRLNPSLCWSNLRSMLENQIVMLAEVDGRIVGKANTNSRGYRYDQIGGVFTEREFRNQGIAQLLVRRLTSSIRSDGKRACLFVKKDNAPALALYRRLGFIQRDDFVITYYA